MENIIDNLDSKCTTTAAKKNNNKKKNNNDTTINNNNNDNNNRELDIEVVHPSGASQGHHSNTSL